MSSFVTSSTNINWLPDELLLQILNDSMYQESQFYPEYCVHISKESRQAQHPSRPGHQQQPHLKDWCIVSATSRNIRRVGREAFFRSKTIAMSYSLPQQLRNGTFSAFGTPTDQKLALRFIRSINLVDMMMTCPSTFLQLPATLQVFPNLKTGVLSFGFTVYDQDLSVLSWVRGEDDVWVIIQLLHDIGVPLRVALHLSLYKKIPRFEFFQFLELDAHPRLQAESDRQRKAEAKTLASLQDDG
ncbi:hypothetical protein F5B18DRAFT_651680 [Nemania serpens]|nr:hypothetical protein F5B18DRAFT_651680 [Nemania serpens]